MKKDLTLYSILTEGVLNEAPVMTPSMFRKYSEEDRGKLAARLSATSLKLIEKLSSRNKNIKDIDKSKGDITKYIAYDSLSTSLKSVRRMIPYGYRNRDLLDTLSVLYRSLELLKYHKKEFVNGYKSEDVLIKSLYRAILSSLSIGVLKVSTKYMSYDNEEIKLNVIEKDLGLINSGDIKALQQFLSSYQDGTLNRLFKSSKSGVLTEEPKPGKTAVDAFIDYLIGELKSDKGEKNSKYQKIARNVTKMTGYAVTIVALIAITRFCITRIYSWRVNIAMYLEEAADILFQELPTITDTEIREKQKQRAEKLNDLARRIDIEDVTSDKEASRHMEKFDQQTERDFRANSGEFEFGIK